MSDVPGRVVNHVRRHILRLPANRPLARTSLRASCGLCQAIVVPRSDHSHSHSHVSH